MPFILYITDDEHGLDELPYVLKLVLNHFLIYLTVRSIVWAREVRLCALLKCLIVIKSLNIQFLDVKCCKSVQIDMIFKNILLCFVSLDEFIFSRSF